jgi:hypothetical protein
MTMDRAQMSTVTFPVLGRTPAREEAPPWGTLVLVCSKCKGARRGPGCGDVRKQLKKQLGKPKSLRVLEVECLRSCPDHAVAACIVDAERPAVSMRMIGSEEDLQALTAELAARAGD